MATTVYALRNRKLVTTPRSKGVWTAIITEAGSYYLEHGSYLPADPAVRPLATIPAVETTTITEDGPDTTAAGMSGTELVTQLLAEDGQITILNPDRAERRRWRRAIFEAVIEGLGPVGQRITYTGRNKGDLVILLVSVDEVVTRPKPAPVPVPERLHRPHPIITATRDRVGDYKTHLGMIDTRRGSGMVSLKISRALLPRSLRIVNALFAAAEHRGLTIAAGNGLATIGAKGHDYLITVGEITQRRPYQHTQAEIDRCARYGYEPYPRHEDVPTGDLQLVLPQSWGHTPALRWRWRDTSRWQVEEKLAEVLDGIEARVDVDEQRRLEAEHQAAL